MKYLILSVFFLCISPLHAQTQQQKWNRQMQLINCRIDIKAGPVTATSLVEMEFYNPNDQELEGLHQFRLHPGQVITAFQLELNGKYRDGTIEEKWKATNAYNRIVGKRIDPALLTMDSPNSYGLRIYPVPPKGSRKITFTVRQLLTIQKDALRYSLPFNLRDTVRNISIAITSPGSDEMPVAEPGLIAGEKFNKEKGVFQLRYEGQNLLINAPVSFSIALPKQLTLCKDRKGGQQKLAFLFKPGSATPERIDPKELTIFWDASFSAKDRDLEKEMLYLQEFLALVNIKKITVIPFNYRLLDTACFYPANQGLHGLKQYLQSIKYDGPTQLGCIRIENSPGLFMLFTDGRNTYGNKTPSTNGSLVHCINSCRAPDLEALGLVAGTGGGKVINLATTSMPEAIKNSLISETWLLDIRSASGKVIIDQHLPVRLEPSMLFTGAFEIEVDSLFFHYGNSNVTKVAKAAIDFSFPPCEDPVVPRFAMLHQFERMISSGDWEKILDFGFHEKVVTQHTAFIVLERVEDYIRYNIEAPEELKEACGLLRYVRTDTRTMRQKVHMEDEFNVINNVVAAYNQKFTKTGFQLPAIQLRQEELVSLKSAGVTAPVASAVAARESGVPGIGGAGNGLQEVVVVGYGAMHKRMMTGAVTYIRSNELSGSGSVEHALQGRVAGMTVTQNAVSGSMNRVLIRGMASMRSNNAPLYVLDGIPVNGDINDVVDINEINSITVLRDAQASAVYGSGAANGAVVIQTKPARGEYLNRRRYQLKDMEDMEYMEQVKVAPAREKMAAYQLMRTIHGNETGFYFDMAEYFYLQGMNKQAFEILVNAAEVGKGSEAVQHAIAYIFESWKLNSGAIHLYQQLLKNNYHNLALHRDLAWAYYQDGQYQAAVDILYNAIKIVSPTADVDKTEQKVTLLYEMNEIIAMHKDSINVLHIPPGLVKSNPLEWRIVLDCNGRNLSGLNGLKIIEPGGNIVYENKKDAANKAFIYGRGGRYNGENTTMVYQVPKAKKGRYKVVVDFYGYSYPGLAPSFIRVKTFKHFGKPQQQIEIKNVLMDNQYGEVEIASFTFE